MSVSTAIANTAVDAFFSFRDNGWEEALKRASDVVVNPALLQAIRIEDADMDVFGHVAPGLTPGMNAAYGRGVDR